MRALPFSLVALAVVASCAKTDTPPPPSASPPPRTAAQQRSLDSTIGASVLPGARVVRGALAVSDSAAKRRALEDSIAKSP